jgi:pimeloyl-ACP methyl ester carboxylesterase
MQLKQYAVVFIALLFGLETTIAIPRFRAVEVLSSRSLSSVDDKKPLSTTSDVQELYSTQYLDHFRHQDTRTWQQRYFYSDRYVRKYDDDSVKETRRQAKTEADAAEYTFLCVGGEGPPLNASVLIDSVHCSGDMLYTAQYLHETWNVNIHLYALEHRFYGTSQPFSDNYYYTNDKLRYLSSDQALHDAAYFLQQQMPNATVVTFGASYPGYLSALLRLKFPHLVSAAVSSSAPVQATLNMISYNDAVGANLQNEQLGGSSACYDVFVEGHAQLNHLVLQPDYHGLLATEFQLCDVDSLLETKNVQLFLGDGVIQWDVQGNDPACTDEFCNIAKVCDVLVSRAVQGAEWSALAWLSRTMRLQSSRESDCIVLDWNETLHQLSQPDEDWRSWLWQTCTEVGYYQTCLPDTKCPYGRGWHPLEQDLEICRVAFNITNVGDNVDATNNRYGGYDMSATRVLSVTGTEDPWTTLAFRPEHPPPNHQPFHSVPGASHHYWTHPPKGTDDIHIQRARQVILEQVMNWLGFDMKRKEDSAVATER